MKHHYLLLSCISIFFLCQNANGQTRKGTFALSGKTDAGFLFSKTKKATDSIETGHMKNQQFTATLGAGYFIADNLNIGISGTYSYSYTNTKNWDFFYGSENIITSFGIIPQVTYFLPIEGKLKPFVSAGAGYLWLQERDSKMQDNHNELYSFSGLSLNAAAGVSYFISDQVSFDLQLQYTRNRLKDKWQKDQAQTQNAIAGTVGISIFF